MKIIKKLALAFCFVLMFSSSAWCINPFQVNPDGFGPKIKGLQLGMRLNTPSLAHLVDFALKTDFIRVPFVLYINVNNEGTIVNPLPDADFCGIKISLTNDKRLAFEVIFAKGAWKTWLQSKGTKKELLGLLSAIEKRGFIDASIGHGNRMSLAPFSNFIIDWGSKRITRFAFEKRDFQANALTDREFLQAFINAYHIPEMNPEQGYGSSVIWRYRNPSQGWEVKCDPEDNILFQTEAVVVSPIITQSTFDIEANSGNNRAVESLLDDDDAPDSNVGDDADKEFIIFSEFTESIRKQTEKISKEKYTAQDVARLFAPVDEEEEEYDDNNSGSESSEVFHMRAWQGKDYVLIQDYNEAWTMGNPVSFWTADPEMVFFDGIKVGSSVKALEKSLGNLAKDNQFEDDEGNKYYFVSLQNQSVVFHLDNKAEKVVAIAYDYWIVGIGQPMTEKMWNIRKPYLDRLSSK